MTTATKERRTKAGGISLSAATLKAALAAVGQAVATRSPRPIFQNVLLSGAVLTGSDGEIRIDVELENAPPGCDFLLPKDRFHAILSSCTSDEITITPDATQCVIKAGRGTWTLPTEDSGEYPSWNVVGAKAITRMTSDQFVNAAKAVVFAVDAKSNRYALGGVNIVVSGNDVFFIATDGRRLALSRVERRQDEATDEVEKLVPVNAIKWISSLAAANKNGTVQLEATGRELIATVGNAKVTALLIQGEFPKWRSTIDGRSTTPTIVSRDELRSATNAAAICTSQESNGVFFTFSGDSVELQGKSPENGEAKVTCGVLNAGDSGFVKMDPGFVTQWLDGTDHTHADPRIEVDVEDENSRVILRSCKHDDGTYGFTGVIMPMAAD